MTARRPGTKRKRERLEARLQVRVPPELEDRIQRIVPLEHRSFASTVRYAIILGLEVLEERHGLKK